MAKRRRIRRVTPPAILAEGLQALAAAGLPASKTKKVTLKLDWEVAKRLHSNAYEMERDKGEYASELIDRGMRGIKSDQRWHAKEAASQGQDGESAESLPAEESEDSPVAETDPAGTLPRRRGRGEAA